MVPFLLTFCNTQLLQAENLTQSREGAKVKKKLFQS